MSTVPLDLETDILMNEPLGSYFRLVFEVKGPLARPLPGQFVSLRLRDGSEPLLRRPFSVCRVLPGPGGRKHMEIVYAVVRGGTRLLSRMKPGERLRVLGPLGGPFPHLDRKHPALIVGGGVGIPPMVHLSEVLKAKRVRQWVFLGARTKKDLVHLDEFRKRKVPVAAVTDDGTSGRKAFVTQALDEFLAEGNAPSGAVIHACGPRAMLRAVAALGEKYEIPTFVSWEEKMGCGLGICLTCVCPHKDGKMERTCVEGPVFDASRIDWDKLPR